MSRLAGMLIVLAACTGPTVVGDLAIDRVVPDTGLTTAPTPVRIEGKNFTRPVRSNLDNGATKVGDVVFMIGDVPLTDARWVDETLLEGTVPAGLQAGRYDVTVKLGGRTSVVTNGFTISDQPLTADAGVDGPPPSPWALTGLHWQLPCVLPDITAHSCTTAPFVASQQTLAGASTERWAVTVRIRGVMENNQYSIPTSVDGWVVGGAPSDLNENSYGFTVSSPAQVYYLNGAPAIGSQAFAWDYQATFLIDGDATVSYVGGGKDIYEWDNYDPTTGQPFPANGVILPVSPYPGQYAFMEVIGVAPAP